MQAVDFCLVGLRAGSTVTSSNRWQHGKRESLATMPCQNFRISSEIHGSPYFRVESVMEKLQLLPVKIGH